MPASVKRNALSVKQPRFQVPQHGSFDSTNQKAARGFARMSQNGAIPHSVYKEMNIASVTKWLTAAGAMRLLDYKKDQTGRFYLYMAAEILAAG
ncbi:hypothetical protein [Paraflavitalea speifideaquila]|uniref:hypothetical protein n=1 Tax=Paraflavitalea speifideaquila TaxID=3076558 RepID=UPI0028EF899C|nr:hypothetical protein [Paraflavitalea speifideiaquila]